MFLLYQQQESRLSEGLKEPDPLVRRNEWFNLRKLGAVGVEYLADFYGPLSDGLNAGVDSDRLFTRWSLPAWTPTQVDNAGAVLLVDERDGFPWPAAVPPADGRVLLVRVPADIMALRINDAGSRASVAHGGP